MSTGKESYYEELSRVQRVEMEKREKEISKNEMVAAATKKAEEEAKKRWEPECSATITSTETNWDNIFFAENRSGISQRPALPFLSILPFKLSRVYCSPHSPQRRRARKARLYRHSVRYRKNQKLELKTLFCIFFFLNISFDKF